MMLLPWKTKQAQLIEKNLENAFIAMSSQQKQYQETRYIFSKIPHPVFNCVIRARTTECELEKTIQTILQDYKEHNTPHCWWITENSEPQEISKYLKKLGFQKGPNYRGMHAEMKDINLDFEISSRIHIEQITEINTFDAWVRPLAESFEFTPNVEKAFSNCYQDLFNRDKRFINYIAFYDNHPAGATTLFLDNDSTGLYNGGVFTQFRDKGVLSHLGKTMLLEAKKRGVEEVVVQVNEAAHNMAIKAGFKEYINFQSYLSPIS